MNKRNGLSLIVRGMFALLFLAFIWVLLSGIGSIEPERIQPNNDVLFAEVGLGETRLLRYQGEPVWVSQLTEQQKLQSKQLDSFIIDGDSGCQPQSTDKYCLLKASTRRDGIIIQFTEREPAQLPRDVLWLGGFVDPTTGHIYDLLGRAYKINKHSPKSLAVIDVQ